MAIENDCPKSRKAQADQALGPLSQLNGADGLCRRHQFSHVVGTPVGVEAPTGVKIRTAEAGLQPAKNGGGRCYG
jgi:hypothetical protein